jgi:hypothetical protein
VARARSEPAASFSLRYLARQGLSDMQQRPISVTFIAGLLIVTAVAGLASSGDNLKNPQVQQLMSQSPIPVHIQVWLIYAGLGVSILSGLGMFAGQNWARFLYVIWNVFAILVGLVGSPIKLLIPSVIFFLMITVFLFRSNASAYFEGRPAEV